MTEPDQYVLGYRRAEQERLQREAQELAHESSWLFDQLGDLHVSTEARAIIEEEGIILLSYQPLQAVW